MDETELDDVVTVGQRLREAREAKGLSVEDIAVQTRIPTRHLLSLETSDWDKLPAATYSVGFAKNYAGAVGLDRAEISEQLRAEMGGTRPVTAYPEVYEAADPARTMPKGLVLGTLALLVLVVAALTWVNNRSLEGDEPLAAPTNLSETSATPAAAPPPQPAADAQVVLTATEAVWVQVKDGSTTLQQGEMAAGTSYTVPATAVAPTLTTGKPEALRIMAGSTPVPPVGQAGRTVSGVSLKAADLIRTPAASAGQAQPAPAAAATAAPRRRTAPASQPTQAPASAEPEPTAPAAANPGQTATQP